jgi:membrane protease YdiL (CAAX protease family)
MCDDSNKQPGHIEVSIAIENPFLKIKTRGLLFWYLLSPILMELILFMFEAIWQISESTSHSIDIILLQLFLFYWIYRKSKQGNIDIHLFFRRISNNKWVHLSGLVLCLLLFSTASSALISEFYSYALPNFPEGEIASYEPKQSIFDRSIYILFAIVSAPIIEEMLFRGILLGRWSAKWGMRKAVLISALAFSIPHFDKLGAFLFAVCMSILYLRTRTLLVPIAAHALNNTIAIVITIVETHNVEASTSGTIDRFLSIAWVKGACFAIALSIIVPYLYRNWPKKDALSPYLLQMKEASRPIEYMPTPDVG